MSGYAFPALVALVVNSALAVYVFRVNPGGRANRAYALLVFFSDIWLLGEFMTGISANERSAWLWSRIMMSGVVFIPSAFFLFTQVFPYKTEIIKRTPVVPATFLLSFIFLVLTWTTNLLMTGISVEYYGFDQRIGELFPVFVAFFFLCIFTGLHSLFKRYLSFKNIIEKEQTFYVLLGTFIPTVLGGTIDTILPIFGYYLPAFASSLSIFMATFLGYAVVKYKLMVVAPVYECDLLVVGSEPKAYDLDPGQVYFVREDSPYKALDILADRVVHCSQALCITDRDPQAIRKRYGIIKTPILTPFTGESDTIEKLEITIRRFVQDAEEGVVLIDTLDSLVLQSSLRSVERFLLGILPDIEKSSSSLLLSYDPEKMGEDELKVLQHAVASRWMDSVLASVTNPVRMDILKALEKGSMSFAELTENLHMSGSPPRLSFHLANLKKAGIIAQDGERNYFQAMKARLVQEMSREIEKGVSKEVGQ